MKNKLKYMALLPFVTDRRGGLLGRGNSLLCFSEENKEVILQLNCQLQTNQEVIVSRASTAENRLNDLHFLCV